MTTSSSIRVPEHPDAGSASRPSVLPYAVLACSLVFYWSISARALIYTVMPTIASELGFSSSTAGLVVASLLFGYCTGGWAAGWLPGSRKARIIAGVGMSVPATVALSHADGFLMAMASTFAVGFGIGVYLPLGMAMLVDMGRGTRGAAYMAIHEVAATFGSFSGSAVLAILLSFTDWHGSVLVWCVVGVAATISFVAVKDVGETPRGDRKAAGRIPLDLKLVSCVLVYGVGAMIVMGLISMLALIMVRAWGQDQASAASIIGSTRLAGMIGVAAVGLLADRVGHGRMMLILQVVALAGLLAMLVNGFGPLFVVGVALLAVGASGNITIVSVVVGEAYSPAHREQIMAYATGPGGFLGMVAAPALFGVMLDAGMPTGPVIFAAAATLLSILLLRQISRH